jgi:site-specific DNA recombinase
MTSIPFPPGTRLVAYLRDSGGRDQNLSVAQQEQSVGDWCRAHDCLLTRVFTDVARSGTSLAGRDQFLAMIDYLEAGAQEKGVLLYELARFSRQYDDTLYYLADLRRRGYVVHSITDPAPDTLEGRLVESITAWKNAKYSQDLQKLVRRGVHYVARTYHAVGGPAPKGYRKVPVEIGKRRDGTPHVVGCLEPDPATAPLVRRAFELRARGATTPEIYDDTRLYKYTIEYHRMFQNKIYLGIRTFGDEEITGFCAPLVDLETWNAVQAVNAARASRQGVDHPRAVRSRFVLTGLLRCGVCGGAMTGKIAKRGPYPDLNYYQCNRRKNSVGQCRASLIPKALIEQRVVTAMRTHLLVQDVLEDVYARSRQLSLEGDASRQAAIQQEKSKLTSSERAIGRLLAAIKDAGHSSALLADLFAQEEQKRSAQERLANLEAAPMPSLPDLDVPTYLVSVNERIDRARPEELGVLLRSCVQSMRAVKPRRKELTGEITFRIPVPGLDQKFVVPL